MNVIIEKCLCSSFGYIFGGSFGFSISKWSHLLDWSVITKFSFFFRKMSEIQQGNWHYSSFSRLFFPGVVQFDIYWRMQMLNFFIFKKNNDVLVPSKIELCPIFCFSFFSLPQFNHMTWHFRLIILFRKFSRQFGTDLKYILYNAHQPLVDCQAWVDFWCVQSLSWTVKQMKMFKNRKHMIGVRHCSLFSVLYSVSNRRSVIYCVLSHLILFYFFHLLIPCPFLWAEKMARGTNTNN